MLLWEIRHGFHCQGMTHNATLKPQRINTGPPVLTGRSELRGERGRGEGTIIRIFYIAVGVSIISTRSVVNYGHRVPTSNATKLLSTAVRRIEKRAKYSRRRAFNDDADIDYINERNAKFNKKAERFYGKYTAEIKQNLERGTAV